MSLDFLLYVDEKYTDSLYNFYYDNIVEIKEAKTKSRLHRIGLAGKLLKSFFIDVNADAEINFDNVTIRESTIHPSTEKKIKDILSAKFNSTPVKLLDKLDDINENGIYFFQGVFELISIVNKNGKVITEYKKTRNHSDGLVWNMRLCTYGVTANVYMALGGDKILINFHHLTVQIEKYKCFSFTILGKISKFDDKNFSIKPIVIFY